MIIELHAIQTFAPSNLNRDDTGNPKEALFGGVRRARISSQSAKRAIRVSEVFRNVVDVPIGTRTKSLIGQTVDSLVQQGVPEATATEYATEVATKLYAKLDKKADNKTSVLVYISEEEKNWIVNTFLDAHRNGTNPNIDQFVKKFEKELQNRTSAPDIALFGRMLAEKPALNIDAACQMAHAISTHEVNTAEFDYFTAVDDLTPDDTSGAGMLGLVPFNSATYYRCARIDWDQLVKNLDGDVNLARQTVDAFMQAFALVVPSGMKNSFVNQHAPDFLLAVARPNNDGQALTNAFEQPIRARNGKGYAEPSIQELAKYWDKIESVFRLSEPTVAVLNPHQFELPSDELRQATQSNLRDWINVILNAIGSA
ncbi:MAG: type I-E CRISPR-associated protein Cas7/Cse4/CasC [Phototrophicales bacterium]|nr:MAG: type I-E CRISPR-associated protein Cas7/Cse4/CasC [Phototrophicales bacterium]RMG70781.1 MAG: type I-E CRISPR-associated protein Cas7/Cse4/CasC [Chloroflexota bacterium]